MDLTKNLFTRKSNSKGEGEPWGWFIWYYSIIYQQINMYRKFDAPRIGYGNDCDENNNNNDVINNSIITLHGKYTIDVYYYY